MYMYVLMIILTQSGLAITIRGSNENLLVRIQCYGIDYFVRDITITCLFR